MVDGVQRGENLSEPKTGARLVDGALRGDLREEVPFRGKLQDQVRPVPPPANSRPSRSTQGYRG
eukprot:6507070-Pyramimonas_sp.AAC.1